MNFLSLLFIAFLISVIFMAFYAAYSVLYTGKLTEEEREKFIKMK